MIKRKLCGVLSSRATLPGLPLFTSSRIEIGNHNRFFSTMKQQLPQVVRHESKANDPLFPNCEYMELPSALTLLSTTSDVNIAQSYSTQRESSGENLRSDGERLAHETFPFTRDISFPISFSEYIQQMMDYISQQESSSNDTGKDGDQGSWMIIRKSRSMEEKWDCYCDRRTKQIYFARSWTGDLKYRVRFDVVQDRIVLLDFDIYSTNSKMPDMTKEQIEFGARVCEWLVGNTFLGVLYYPLWLPQVPQWDNDAMLAVWMFSQCGNQGLFAAEKPFSQTTDWIIDRLRPKPTESS